jgi:ribosome-associated heat shock protein Hsp15
MPKEVQEVRIDKWLWAVRIYKTRNQAAEACKAGKVKIEGNSIKPSRDVKVGEVISVSMPPLTKTYQVLGLLENRVSAPLARDYALDLTPPEEIDRVKMMRELNFERRDFGVGRPTKRDRREIDRLKNDHSDF